MCQNEGSKHGELGYPMWQGQYQLVVPQAKFAQVCEHCKLRRKGPCDVSFVFLHMVVSGPKLQVAIQHIKLLSKLTECHVRNALRFTVDSHPLAFMGSTQPSCSLEFM